MARIGKLAKKRRVEGGTEPGQVMLLALLAAAPVVVLFVLGPFTHAGEPAWVSYPRWWWVFLVATPLLSLGGVVRYYRATKNAREHNASRFGRMLSFANLAIWLLYAGTYLVLRYLHVLPASA